MILCKEQLPLRIEKKAVKKITFFVYDVNLGVDV